ncbi:hypothetical protein GCM10027290_24100 [Micromonospora sonneratiae]|uniref:DUF7507 domain-containing protein n=1 Tax=Micromonospora sonneratiae TaxID=1184706 RepID=A0ABW3YED5_9ACTN
MPLTRVLSTKRVSRLVAATTSILIIGGLPLVGSAPAHAQPGTPLVEETFTGATADPRFEAYGSACLTGAPAGAPPGPGEHPLGSCSNNRVGPVPPAGGAPHGYLQLTDASNDQAGAVLFNQPIPANQGLEVTFEQWQYGSTTPATPADGISFFLVDGAGGLTAPGAFGGSLGYAQKLPDDNPANTFLPGVNNGYLGIGLDVLGNYFGDWEQRGNGCAQRSPAGTIFRIPAPGPNMVTVRGPGNGTEGYCFLTATTSNFTTTGPWPSTLPGQLQGPLTSLPPGVTPQQAEALLEPSKRTVTVRVSPAPNPQVTVSIDFNDGNGSQQVLAFAAPQPVPATYKLGFAASTGLFTDVHLIRNVSVSSLEPLPTLNLVKQVDIDPPLPPVIGVGTNVPYEFVVTNTGLIPITELVVSDPVFDTITCPTTTLAPGQTTVCTATYTVTQADVDAGIVVNTAVASGNSTAGPVTSPPSQASLPLGAGTGALSLTKIAEPSTVSAAGQQVSYEYVVTNTGDVTISGLTAVDTTFTGTGTPPTVTCPITSLAPGAQTICTGAYTVTQADVDAGTDITNTAIASGSAPDGTTVNSPLSSANVDIVATSSLALVKSVDPSTVTAAGQTVTYSFLVTNNGDTTITGLAIDETSFTGTGTLSPVVCPVTTLAPAASTTCTATYAVTQADVDAGSITDTATATGTDPGGDAVTSPPSTATVDVDVAAGLLLTKVADPSSVSAAGQQVTYRYVVTNTGTATVTALTVTDTTFTGTGTPPTVTCPVTTLAPDEQTTCTGTYTVTQADIDAGSVTNTATATGTTPGGPTTSDPSTVVVDVVAAPSLALVKSAEPTTVTAAGQQIRYAFLVVNNGNVTITDLTINETAFTGTGSPPTITCPVTALAPAQETTCGGTYTVTQADIDAGSVTDTAEATGNDPTGSPRTSPPSTAVVEAAATAALSVVKSAEPTSVTAAGQQVTFSFAVTNTGNVTLRDVDIIDITFTGSGPLAPPTCPPGAASLAPGDSITCTATYTVTQADVDAGSISNTASATGTPPPGVTPPQAPPSTVTVPTTGTRGLGVTKTGHAVDVNDNGRIDAGDRIDWTLTVTNLGATTIRNITVSDELSGAVTCPGSELAPGAAMNCTVPPHTITAADVAAGRVVNVATATGVTGDGTPVTSEPARASVDIKSLPVTGTGHIPQLVAAGLMITAGGVLLLVRPRRSRRGTC